MNNLNQFVKRKQIYELEHDNQKTSNIKIVQNHKFRQQINILQLFLLLIDVESERNIDFAIHLIPLDNILCLL